MNKDVKHTADGAAGSDAPEPVTITPSIEMDDDWQSDDDLDEIAGVNLQDAIDALVRQETSSDGIVVTDRAQVSIAASLLLISRTLRELVNVSDSVNAKLERASRSAS